MRSNHLTVSDGATLHYLESGEGSPIVMIPGGAQTAEQFRYQIPAFEQRYHVYAIDMRGHGDSDDPGFGYRISRFAEDLEEFLIAKQLSGVNLLGHSLGCSVVWNYWDTFGPQRLAKLVLVDEPAVLLANPAWPEAVRRLWGSTFTPATLYDTLNALVNDKEGHVIRDFVGALTTRSISARDREWIVRCMLKMKRTRIAEIYLNNITQDWRDVIARIDIPTLVIGGRVSATPWESQEWIHQQIPNSQLEIFEEEEGGGHFMFIENPGKFNEIVLEFLGRAE